MIKIKVPATTANLGSGFDTFGLALTLYNEFSVDFSDSGDFSITTEPKNRELEDPEKNLFVRVIKRVFQIHGSQLPPLKIYQKNNIPVARGLGSSATAIVASILAGYKLLGKSFSEEEFFKIAYEFEPHPDNLLPAWKGNFIIAVKEKEKTYYQQLDFPEKLKAIVVIPELELSTEEARKVLPEKIPISDAIFNIQRAALLVSIIQNKNFDLLKVAMEDKIHQPYRKKLIPGFDEAKNEGYKNGALGVAISGAGSTIVAFAKENFEKIGSSMAAVIKKEGLNVSYKILNVDKKGAQIWEEDT